MIFEGSEAGVTYLGNEFVELEADLAELSLIIVSNQKGFPRICRGFVSLSASQPLLLPECLNLHSRGSTVDTDNRG